MGSYRGPPTRAERAKAIAAVAFIHLALGVLILSGSTVIDRAPEQPPTRLIDVALPPPPPPPPKPMAAVLDEAGKTGKLAKPTPIVMPPPKVAVKSPNPLPTATVAGAGSAPKAGTGTSGDGPGSGGSGSGAGGGGSGGSGGGIGEDARLLSGGLDRRDYRRLRAFAAPSGRAVLALMIGPEGRITQCSTRQSSGDPALDAALCAILQPRMRWAPARDRSGRTLTVGLYYTATWNRD